MKETTTVVVRDVSYIAAYRGRPVLIVHEGRPGRRNSRHQGFHCLNFYPVSRVLCLAGRYSAPFTYSEGV